MSVSECACVCVWEGRVGVLMYVCWGRVEKGQGM